MQNQKVRMPVTEQNSNVKINLFNEIIFQRKFSFLLQKLLKLSRQMRYYSLKSLAQAVK